MKTRYRFSHRAGGFYYWYSVLPVDSRYEQIICPVDWFWRRKEVYGEGRQGSATWLVGNRPVQGNSREAGAQKDSREASLRRG